jgi:hypothetical protein
VSTSTNQKTIETFLQQSLQFASKMEVVVEHLDVTGRGSSIHRVRWDGNNPDIDEVKTKIWEAADHHASVMGTVQKYRVKAYDLDDNSQRSDIPISTTSIKVEPTMLAPSDGADTFYEPPTHTGVLAMFMRHNQEMMRLTIASTGALTSHLARTVEVLSEKNEVLMNERVRAIETMEELMSRKDEREIEKQKATAEIENKKLIWGKILELAPIAINKLAGQELVRQRHSGLESTVMTFIETINPQKLDMIAKSGIFSERQMVLFGTILEQVMKTMVTPEQKAEIQATADKASVGDLGDIGLAAAAALMGKK